MGRNYKTRSPEVTKRLLNNKEAIENWLEIKVYQLPFATFSKIKASLFVTDLSHLTEQEKFIRNLVVVYKNRFRTLPHMFS